MRVLIICLSLAMISLISCKGKMKIADSRDYEKFLDHGQMAKAVDQVKIELGFWHDRLANDTGSYITYIEMARQSLGLFSLTGGINYLTDAELWMKKSSAKLNETDPEILFALCQNAITKHAFNDAATYRLKAERSKGDIYISRLLQFDINMELGYYREAFKSLQTLKDRSAFDYLIRKAKWEDHLGNLPGAISYMESAFEKVKDKKKNLYCWALSNLADMYGHAGQIEKAYQAYLDVLEKEPVNMHCLKGIAWIAYSHDNNPKEATRILEFILSQSEIPELRLHLAEIAETDGDQLQKEKQLNKFLAIVTQPAYGNMYNKYLIGLYAEDLNEPARARELAEKELTNRHTPETSDWLAWTYFLSGEKEKALLVTRDHVFGKTFEPDANFHSAMILAANGETELAGHLLKDCLESSFELGPVASKKVRATLKSL